MLNATAGKHAPDHDHRALCRARAGTRRTSARARSSTRWSTSPSASSTRTRWRCTCATRRSPGSTSSPTATAASTTTSAARAGRATCPRAHGRLREGQPAARAAGGGGIALPARAHPARLPRSARDADDRSGRSGRGELQYAEIWKAAQRLTSQAGEVRHGHARARRRSRAGRLLPRACRRGSWRSATRSTRSCTTSPTPAAR